ncbi:hypothetical protein [Homoserinimonas hongtaonis]|uniref:hypothetical protein n=1 Tax=Homoserinimonas hongtaonis TaxID=2079791 RepID=UPI00131F36AA|nr:hypothetical protein [Salinibacterium hongtaonis]
MTHSFTVGRMIDRGVERDSIVTSPLFEIVIKGTLSDPVAALLEGFRVTEVASGWTHLVGPIPDQARLQGILSVFSYLNIELVSVNPVTHP